MFNRLRNRLRRPVDHLVIESAPLHTERPEWAVKAPSQVAAACKRGADVIGFTEVHTSITAELAAVAKDHGYLWLHGTDDVAIAYKASLTVLDSGDVPPGLVLAFDFHGRRVAVFAVHWETLGSASKVKARTQRTADLIAAMGEASKSSHVAFFLADSNPSKPLSDPTGEPQRSLAAAGLPLVWAELDTYPTGVGVTTIGRNSVDTSVSAVSVTLSDPLGSDHHPATATYGIKRIR